MTALSAGLGLLGLLTAQFGGRGGGTRELIHLIRQLLDLCNGFTRIEMLRADLKRWSGRSKVRSGRESRVSGAHINNGIELMKEKSIIPQCSS